MFPFGIQIKGVIVGILIAYFVIPFVQRLIVARRGTPAT